MEYNNHRKNLELYWRQFFPKWTIPIGFHVHHIRPKCTFTDKTDPAIHHPRNLIALHPDDHVSIHRCRGDNWANNSFLKVLGNKTSGMLGKKHSEETKIQISKKLKGRKMSQEIRKKRKGSGNSFFGKKHSKEAKKKMSESSMGQGTGKLLSNKTKKLISEAKTGVKREPFSIEHKQRISESMKLYYKLKKQNVNE